MLCFKTTSTELEGRIDPSPYHPTRKTAIERLKKTKFRIKPLSSVASFRREIHEENQEEFKYLGLENIQSNTGILLDSEIEKTDFGSAFKFYPGDVLFPKLRPYLNKVYLSDFEGFCSTEFHVLESKLVKPEYLSLFLSLQIVVDQTTFLMTGNTLPRLQTNDVQSLMIPIPPDSVQKKVIEIHEAAYTAKKEKESEAGLLLNSIDDYVLHELGIELPEQKSKKVFMILSSQLTGQRYDPLFYSQEIFKHIRTAKYGSDLLENLIDDAKSGFAAGKADQELVDVKDAIIQIRPTNIDEHGQFIFERNVYISKEQLQSRGKDLLQKGEVLFNNTNSQEQVGKTAYFDLDGQYFCSNHITRIMTKPKKLDPVFLYVILNIYQNIRVFYNICTNWNNQSGVNVELLSSLPIPTPSLAIQQRIAEEVQSRIERAKQLKQEALDDLQTAKAQVERLILGEAG